MVGWHHRFNGHESEQTLEDSEGQGSLGCCSQWGHKELTMTEPLSTQCMCRGRECMGNLPSQTSIFKKSLKRKGF